MTTAKRALVTGVSGQDGWYLSQLLRDKGYQVSGLVRDGDAAEIPDGVTVLTGDLADSDSIAQAIATSRPTEIYNLGALSSVGMSWEQPLPTAEVTGLGLLRLIHAVRQAYGRETPDVRLIQASSAEIFGDAPAPQNENTPIAPVTPYGAAKAYAHHSAKVYRRAGLFISTGVLYNHESPRRPDTFVSRRITLQVAMIARGKAERLSIGSLDSRRDWGFAGDYVGALYLIAQHPIPDDFVIASGQSRSVGDFVAAAFARVGITDWRQRVELDPDFVRPVDTAEQRGDASKAREVLGWRPSLTFEEMVAEMVDADLARVDAP
ncbi:MAG: GDPmannose 4,6-dehydratase [Frankiales bacterium]|nr:GDPmannose 4,6-dehydratase [Frankiales bacterium]